MLAINATWIVCYYFLITTYLIGVQKLYGPEIAQFLPCMVLFLDNLRRLSIFSNYLREIDHFKLNMNEGSNVGLWAESWT